MPAGPYRSFPLSRPPAAPHEIRTWFVSQFAHRRQFPICETSGSIQPSRAPRELFAGASPGLTSGPNRLGWGVTTNEEQPWVYNDLVAIKKDIEANDLVREVIENFDPSHWYDVLLDGLRKHGADAGRHGVERGG